MKQEDMPQEIDRLAKLCGATENEMSTDGGYNLCFTERALAEFATKLREAKDNESLAIKPLAWRRVSNICGEVRGVFETQEVELRSEHLEPLFGFEDYDRLARLCEAKDKELEAAKAQIAMLSESFNRLRLPHQICEDRWYSCPLSSEGCADEREVGCTCGAEAHNELIDKVLSATSEDAEAWLCRHDVGLLDKYDLMDEFEQSKLRVELRKNGGK